MFAYKTIATFPLSSMLFESNRLVKHRVDGRDGGFWSELVS